MLRDIVILLPSSPEDLYGPKMACVSSSLFQPHSASIHRASLAYREPGTQPHSTPMEVSFKEQGYIIHIGVVSR